MTKFKVGNFVWVKPIEELCMPIGMGFNTNVFSYCGKRLKISYVYHDDYYVLDDAGIELHYNWMGEWLESEEEHQQRMVDEMKKRMGKKNTKLKDLKPGTIFHYYRDKLVKVSVQVGNFILCIKINDGSPAVFDENVYVKVDIPEPLEPVEKFDVLATRALEHFGATSQICQTMEECAELIQALNKSLRHQDDPEKVKQNILEELADVTIMVEQMKLHFDEDEEFDEILEAKMDKLRSYLSEQEAD